MITVRLLHRSLLVALVAMCTSLAVVAADSPTNPDTVLISNSLAAVTRRDYDAELSRLPADIRDGFANSPQRVQELPGRLLLQKSLAAKARAAKLDTTPEYAARLALEIDRWLAAIELDAVDRAAAAEFDANVSRYETRARELYLVNKSTYTLPAQVEAAHILFDTKDKYTAEDARRKAEETRARLVAGADFATLARELSDDRGSAAKGGDLGWFIEKEMDPAFGAAAFALQKPGDLSPPVRSAFGWHIIKLEGKKPAVVQPYADVRERILAELKQRFVGERRDAAIAAIRSDPKVTADAAAIDALTPKIDPEALRRAQELARTPSAAPAPAPAK